ncbi:hypothetical protein RFI_23523 [Reticulomyxa filosa]|uniref:Uncharacterized protein n=1 Tax=Reticulomyxa filosa TaxID=46433 RepID=X6MJM3_RETFI|nr:hypothetical protein RFI_23523 [Reticulomyxa filosa]|eukprot:ETO13846.1 hypothetical protein RFI_23523 [Reticulomyxa filosa]
MNKLKQIRTIIVHLEENVNKNVSLLIGKKLFLYLTKRKYSLIPAHNMRFKLQKKKKKQWNPMKIISPKITILSTFLLIDCLHPFLEKVANLDIITLFQTLSSSPVSFQCIQCVAHKDEIIICGGVESNECYSFHILKNKYKYICSYPENVSLLAHNVVKRVNNNNTKKDAVTLLSFGGSDKHTLVMEYVSVWDNNENTTKKENTKKRYNMWLPLIDNENKEITIGKADDILYGGCAIIGGSDNHLLFFTHGEKYISVFNLNTFQHVKCEILPIDYEIKFPCFVSKTDKNKKRMK